MTIGLEMANKTTPHSKEKDKSDEENEIGNATSEARLVLPLDRRRQSAWKQWAQRAQSDGPLDDRHGALGVVLAWLAWRAWARKSKGELGSWKVKSRAGILEDQVNIVWYSVQSVSVCPHARSPLPAFRDIECRWQRMASPLRCSGPLGAAEVSHRRDALLAM
jgi:hypothetical protein